MAKKRVHEIAKERGIPSKEVIAKLQSAGFDVKAAASSVDERDIATAFDPRPAPEPAAVAPAQSAGGDPVAPASSAVSDAAPADAAATPGAAPQNGGQSASRAGRPRSLSSSSCHR